MKPLFSNKSIHGDKINLTENGKHVKTEIKTVEVINSSLKYNKESQDSQMLRFLAYCTKYRRSIFKNHGEIYKNKLGLIQQFLTYSDHSSQT